MDNIIEKRVEFGKAQWLPFIFLFIVDLNDGCQIILSSFLAPIVQDQWKLSSHQVSILTVMFFLGTFFGSLVSGYLADRKGRRFSLRIGSVMQLLSAFLFIMADDYLTLNIVRLLYGISFGFTIVLSTSMFAETSTLKYRGKGLLFINIGASLGKILGVILAYICLQNFREGNWKLMMLLSSLPNIAILFGVFFVIKQSPRFLAAQKRFEQCFTILEEMIKINHPNRQTSQNKLTDGEKSTIIQWHKQIKTSESVQIGESQHNNPSFVNQQTKQKNRQDKSIFNQAHLRTTIMLCCVWFSINFMYFGQLVVLPFIYGEQQKSFSSYALTIAGQMPSILISLYFVDRQGCGRKMSLFYFFILSGIFHGAFIAFPFTIIASLTRLLMKMCFQMLYPFTTQSFNTLSRTFGFGFCMAIGRIGSMVMSITIFPLEEINYNLIFVCFIVSALIGSITTFFVPKQPMNKPLDQKKEEQRYLEMNG